MNKIKFILIFISASLVIFISGCGILPPPFMFHSHHHSDRDCNRKDMKFHVYFGDDFREKLQHKIHDKLDKMKIKIKNKNDSLDVKLNLLHDRLEHMHIKIDSLNRDLIIKNDSLPYEMDIEINMDDLNEKIKSSLEGLDKEIELSINGSLPHLEELEDLDMEDIDIEHPNFDIKIEKMDGDKVMIIKYFDEDSKEWKEIKIDLPHRANKGEEDH